MASNPNLSNPNHEVDKTKGYKKVIFQQGKPILDQDLNDLGQIANHVSESIVSSRLGAFTPSLDYREWAFVPCDPDATSARNQNNFALTLGRLDTLKGLVDTSVMRDGVRDSKVVFDHAKIIDASLASSSDQGFVNYILKGTVTALGATTTSFQDDTKSFNDKYGLAGIISSESISIGSNSDSLINTDVTDTTSASVARVRLREGAARVRFLTGNNINEERVIKSYNESGVLNVEDAFSNPPDVGDEYIILPANTIESYINDWNAKVGDESAFDYTSNGDQKVDSIGSLIVYVQVFDNLVSADEDSDIQSSLLGQETTWRNELRWCIRVARFNGSLDGDVIGGTSPDTLKIDHLYKYVLDASKAILSHHASIDNDDFSDSTIANREYLQTHYWKSLATNSNDYAQAKIGGDIGPLNSIGVSPSQVLRAIENDKIIWVALKAMIAQALNGSHVDSTNDVQVLYRFTAPHLTSASDTETLSSIIYAGYEAQSGQKSFIQTSTRLKPSEAPYGKVAVTSGQFFSSPRTFHSSSDLSLENMRSRILYGYGSDFIYDDTLGVIAFSSQAEHLSFVDQMLLGMTGLGAWQGKSNDNNWLSGPVGHTWGLDSTLSQSGYGSGSIKMVNGLGRSASPSSVEVESGLSNDGSYLTRKSRSGSHVINWDDPDGWSVYKERKDLDEGIDNTSLTTRQWSEGMAQAYEFQQGLNFRKLAIKTIAHKSMDLFAIGSTPALRYRELSLEDYGSVTSTFDAPISDTFFVPYNNVEVVTDDDGIHIKRSFDTTYNTLTAQQPDIPNESYGTRLPALIDYNYSPYLDDGQSEPSAKVLELERLTSSDADKNLNRGFGMWGRFNQEIYRDDSLNSPSPVTDQSDSISVISDLWSNRCTAMRLRYHIGDFYPSGDVDARGVPRNLLVDSLNLFVKIEPLSLAHWMTMPKHQHTILKNSFSVANGVEALLKISHGLGDTQKLIQADGSPLAQVDSPSVTHGMAGTTTAQGSVDPLDLPFGHEYQPFIHWYHPAMDKIKSTSFQAEFGTDQVQFTPYEKWGRRSVIVPALVPSNFFDATVSNDTEFTVYQLESGLLGGHSSGFYQANSVPVTSGVRLPILQYDYDFTINGQTTQFNSNNAFDNQSILHTDPDQIQALYTTLNDVALDVSNRAKSDLPVVDPRKGIQPSLFPYPAHFSTQVTPNAPDPTAQMVIQADNRNIDTRTNRFTFPSVGIQEHQFSTAGADININTLKQHEIGPRPVFLPASRSYAHIADNATVPFHGNTTDRQQLPSVGFHPLINSQAISDWDSIRSAEGLNYPYDEKANSYVPTASAALDNITRYEGYNREETAWEVPVMRAALRTRTVAAVVDLVRTSFDTGLADQTLSDDYDFTLPKGVYSYDKVGSDVFEKTFGTTNKVPSVGPDHDVDTLFVGDSGTSVAGFSNRSYFLDPLHLGMPTYIARPASNGEPSTIENGFGNTWTLLRDSFQALKYHGQLDTEGVSLFNTFFSLHNMGLQQKLLLNCSLRVLHHRPSSDGSSGKVKSLTEAFICNDRDSVYGSANNGAVALPDINGEQWRKPFLHLSSMHPLSAGTSSTSNNSSRHPNYDHLKHLSPMVSDTIGGNIASHSAITTEEFNDVQVSTSPMGDTFSVDPFDYHYNQANMKDSSSNPLRESAQSFQNSGIELQLIQELDVLHAGASDRNLTQTLGSGTSTTMQDLIPTSNELCLPGDHELVFVLYPGWYGSNMYASEYNSLSEFHPTVAGCHISATVEVNRPSERVSSTSDENVHYGATSEGSPINVYSISSTNVRND